MTSSRLHMAFLTACVTALAALAPAQRAAGQQAAAPSASQPAQATAADSKAADTPAADAAAAQKQADEVLLRDASNAGFKPENIRGTRMFCRTATELGSNFPVRTCYNEEQVRIKIQEYQAERNELDRITKIPTDIH